MWIQFKCNFIVVHYTDKMDFSTNCLFPCFSWVTFCCLATVVVFSLFTVIVQSSSCVWARVNVSIFALCAVSYVFCHLCFLIVLDCPICIHRTFILHSIESWMLWNLISVHIIMDLNYSYSISVRWVPTNTLNKNVSNKKKRFTYVDVQFLYRLKWDRKGHEKIDRENEACNGGEK